MVDFNMPDSFIDWQPNFSGFNGIFNTPDSPATIYQENIDFKILEIQNQIQKTFDFCEKVLKAKYESLLAELRNFILNNDTKAVAHIPPSSVEFVTNLFNIKACITETFGYLNISSLDLNQLGYVTDFNKQVRSFICRSYKFKNGLSYSLIFLLSSHHSARLRNST